MGAAAGQPHQGRCENGHWWNEGAAAEPADDARLPVVTAREEARSVAWGRCYDQGTRQTTTADVHMAADAASDVWEPIVRGLIAAAEASVVLRGGPLTEAVRRAREAVG